jgi:hypothetical protein
VSSVGLFIFENDVDDPSKRESRKTLKKIVFCWPLEGQ